MKKLLAIFPLFLFACASPVKISEGARNIQVLKESNTIAETCTKLGPVNATVDEALPAQSVYDAAVWKARNMASDMGADSIIILNSDHSINGLANIITVQAIALKCY